MLLTPNATRQSIALLVVLLCLGAAARGAVAQTAADGWSGEVQCTVAVRAPGYQDDLIHTWTVSTLPTARNDFRDYPATWTLTGSGTRAIPAAVRTGAGAAPEKWDRKAVDSNSSITLFVPGDRTSLRIAPGQRPVRAAGELRVAGASSPMSADADEWRFLYIDVPGGATQTSLSGSRTQPRNDLVGWRAPSGAAVTETCTWNLTKQGAAASASALNTEGCTGVAGNLKNLYSAMRTEGTRQYDLLIQSARDPKLATALTAQKQRMLATLASQQQQDIDAATNTCGAPSSSAPVAATASALPLSQVFELAKLPLTVSPGSMPQNRPSLAVTLVGKNTHFAQGTTKADFHLSGSATATTVTVTSPTTATAQLTLPAGTPTGRYTVTLTTGLEVAEAVDAFMVTPTPDNVSNICAAANNLGNLFQGASSTMTGAIEADGVADWFKVSFSAGTTLNLTLRNAVAGTGGSEFQMQVFSACGIPLGAATTGGGQKTLTVPDSGPHAVIVRVFASVWNVAGPMYSLVLDGR